MTAAEASRASRSPSKCGLVTDTLPPIVEAIRAGKEPQASRAFVQLRWTWRPFLLKLRRKFGGRIEDFDQYMDTVLLKCVRKCTPSNLVFKWWTRVMWNACIDAYKEESDKRVGETLTAGGSVPDAEDPRYDTETAYWLREGAEMLPGQLQRLQGRERAAVDKFLRRTGSQDAEGVDMAVKRMRRGMGVRP